MTLCPANPVQEMVLLRSQMSGQINVAVDAGPSTDLNQVMTEIRDHYEGVIGKNRKDLESWYQNKVRRSQTILKFGIHVVQTIGLRVSLRFCLSLDGSRGAGCQDEHRNSRHKPHRDQGPEEHLPEAPD